MDVVDKYDDFGFAEAGHRAPILVGLFLSLPLCFLWHQGLISILGSELKHLGLVPAF